MKQFAAAIAFLVLAGCSDSSAPPASDATPPATSAPGEKTPLEILAGDAKFVVGPDGARGCKDKAAAEKLVAASKKEDQSEFITLSAEGLKDQSCRGFVTGLGVSVEKSNEGGWDCILSIDDPDNKACYWVETGMVVPRG